MAVEKILVNVGNNQVKLQRDSPRVFSGFIEAPETVGIYTVTINSYDDDGNVFVSRKGTLEVSLWKTPKTNWTINDRFNWADYNRIKNNLQHIYEMATQLWKPFDIEDMGEDITEYTGYVTAESINQFERNLETINKNILTQDFGFTKTFYPNGVFIDWNELNRIESATLVLKELLDRQMLSLRKIPFRFGRFKEVRI